MPVAQGTHFIYTVRPGDTLYSIAQKLGSNVQKIEQLNALYPPFTDPGLIYPGQDLIVPYLYNPANQVFYFVKPGDTLYGIATRYGSNIQRVLSLNPQITDPNLIYSNTAIQIPAMIYEVSSGENLNAIARQLGVSVEQIIQVNRYRPGFSPDVLYPGYGLIIPAS
ncbi:MAG: LysM peptidoglycan-binding domain-containing protein [Bacillaceae bacterium]|nr:LysM peptidoglycan-binding domain-containing protein [Bacillaceae bacterium]